MGLKTSSVNINSRVLFVSYYLGKKYCGAGMLNCILIFLIVYLVRAEPEDVTWKDCRAGNGKELRRF